MIWCVNTSFSTKQNRKTTTTKLLLNTCKYVPGTKRNKKKGKKKKKHQILLKDLMSGEIFKWKSEKARQIKQWQERNAFKLCIFLTLFDRLFLFELALFKFFLFSLDLYKLYKKPKKRIT